MSSRRSPAGEPSRRPGALTESRKLFGEVDPAAPGLKWTQPCSAKFLAGSILPRGGSSCRKRRDVQIRRSILPCRGSRLGRSTPPSRGLSLAGPLRRAVGEFLPFPYGQAELDPLDDGLEDAQRLLPVGG